MIDNSLLISAYTHLRDVRKKLTYQQVANDTGYSRPLVSKVLNNKQDAPDGFTKKFEQVYNIRLKDYARVRHAVNPIPIEWQKQVDTRFAEQEGYNLVFEEKLNKIIKQQDEIIKLLKAIGR